VLLLLAVGCSAQRVVIIGAQRYDVEALLDAHPPDPAANITPFPLGHSARTSQHLVYVRDRERPHTHPRHDIAVTLLRGTGTMWIDAASTAMRAGDTVVIPADTPHYFVNTGAEPAAAFVVYAPPHDGSAPRWLDGP
jgi:quercetin dioxygenase-like cupin family protein